VKIDPGEIKQNFEKNNSLKKVLVLRDILIKTLLYNVFMTGETGNTKEDYKSTPERKHVGRKRLDKIIQDLVHATSHLGAFESLLFWLVYPWGSLYSYYDKRPRLAYDSLGNLKPHIWSVGQSLLLDSFPEFIKSSTYLINLESSDTNEGHFAFLFDDKKKRIRRIVTDFGFYELRGVFGHSYVDITHDGVLLSRGICEPYDAPSIRGSRAFFDGKRLMSRRYCLGSCAPSPGSFADGYVMGEADDYRGGDFIVNGRMFHLSGKPGIPTYHDHNIADKWQSVWKQIEDPPEIMKFESGCLSTTDSVRSLGANPKLIGEFEPSETEILDNGFTLYHWSKFNSFEDE